MKIGFIGLGNMGGPMVNNLIKAGFDVSVYDISKSALYAMEKVGAKTAKSIAELAKRVEIIITSVQTSQQLNDICLGEGGIFANGRAGTLYMDCSSTDIKVTRLLHEKALLHHIQMVDAPVSGGVAGAKAATLTFMVGGEEAVFEKVKPLCAAMGKKIVYAGPAGSGQAAKICNNLLLGISMIGVGEAFSLATSLGLDAKKFFEISSNASGQCWSMTSYCPVPGILPDVPANHDYAPGFMAKMMLKDLRLAQRAAEMTDAIIPLGSIATELYELYVNEGFGEKDFSGIINLIAKRQN